MENNPMPALERLPNLRFLNMSYEAYCGSQMVCSAYGFPKLETLKHCSLLHVRKWIVKNGAMSSLKKLHIERIRNLKMIPEGLKFVTTLKELSITFVRNFKQKNGIQGRDYYKVRHIPSISII